jgi:hypothetical protein
MKLLCGVLALCVAFIAGYTVQGWRMEAATADDMKQAEVRYHTLELATVKQNSGIELLNYKLTVADEARSKAEQNAVFIRNQLEYKTKRANELVVTNCMNMVNQLKGVTQ